MSGKRILIIEDSMDIQLVLKQLFDMEGYDVECVANGQDALILLNRTDRLPDLIFLDLMMPVMDGFEFRSEQMKDARLAQIPVVVMSADGNLSAKRGRLSGAEAIKKPVDMDVLLEMTRRYCN